MQIAAHTADVAALDAVLAGGLLTHYQPIVDLDGGDEVVAFEALTRLPDGSPYRNPDQLFAAARRQDRLVPLDLACIRSALTGAAALPAGQHLFVNIEPSTLDGQLGQLHGWRRGAHELTLEITERALGRAPAALIRAVHEAREHGVRIALDDVGAHPESLAYLPLLQPDVVKLDMALIRHREDRDAGAHHGGRAGLRRTLRRHHPRRGRGDRRPPRTGADAGCHARSGLAVGQGRAPATDGRGPAAAATGAHRRRPARGEPVPARGGGRCQRAAGAAAHAAADLPPDRGAGPGDAGRHPAGRLPGRRTVHAGHLGALRTPGARCSLIAAFGVDFAPEPVPGVRGTRIDAGDPLADEWTVVALGPQYAGALTARWTATRATARTDASPSP
ncbi:MAG: EAL domain-containing protein [Acidimicrobiales bacterium]